MHAALRAMYECETSRQGFTKADLTFHQAILEASGNPFLQSIGSVIGAALATSFTISSPVSSDERFKRGHASSIRPCSTPSSSAIRLPRATPCPT